MKIVTTSIKTHLIDYVINNVYNKWSQSLKSYGLIKYNVVKVNDLSNVKYFVYVMQHNEYWMYGIHDRDVVRYIDNGILNDKVLGISMNEAYGKGCVESTTYRLTHGTSHGIPWRDIYEIISYDYENRDIVTNIRVSTR